MEEIGGDQYQYTWIPDAIGEISYYIVVNDTTNNQVTTSTYTISVIDTIVPTWVVTPTDQTIEFGSGFTYPVEATDLSGIAEYWINDTSHFNITQTGIISNATLLSVGNYSVELRAYDSPGNFQSATIKVTVFSTTAPPDDDT
ncbi:MAG: hypothetical protein ACTSYI_13725 [Promethearchaeota archaeon]